MDISGNHKHQPEQPETLVPRPDKPQHPPKMGLWPSLLSYAKPLGHLALNATLGWFQPPDQPFASRSSIERNGLITVSSQCPCGWMSGQTALLTGVFAAGICVHKRFSFFVNPNFWGCFFVAPRQDHHLSLVCDRTVHAGICSFLWDFRPIKPFLPDFVVWVTRGKEIVVHF